MDEVVQSQSEVVEPVAAVEPAAPVTEVRREMVSAEKFILSTYEVDSYEGLSELTGLPVKTCYTRYSQLKKKGANLNTFKGATGKGGRKRTDMSAINAKVAALRASATTESETAPSA
jgi:hypothetical protein